MATHIIYKIPLALVFAITLLISQPVNAEAPIEQQEVIINIDLTIPEKIIKMSEQYGLNSSTMLAIAKAESQFKNVPNYLYTDENGRHTAFGIFQINGSTYEWLCGPRSERFDIDKNIECAMIIASQSGLHHWNESKHGWN